MKTKVKLNLGISQVLAEATGLDSAAIQKFGLAPEQLAELFSNIPHEKRGNRDVILGHAQAARALVETLERGEIDDEIYRRPDLADQVRAECERGVEVLQGRIRRCEQTKTRSAGGPVRA